MQFQVPQFIEVEDKIFGPLTFKQFIYVIGGLGTAYIFWRLLPIYLAGPIGLAVVAFSVALAFLQYNNRPFILTLENAFYYAIHPHLYLWNNEHRAKQSDQVQSAQPSGGPGTGLYVPKLSESRLHELAWSLDIKERIAAGTQTEDESPLGRPEGERRDVLAMMQTARDARIDERGRSMFAKNLPEE